MSILVCISEPAEKSLECIINTNTGSLNPPVKKWKWVWSLDNLYYHPNCYQILTIMTLIILREIIFEKSFQIFFLRKHSIIKSFLEVIFDNQYQYLVFSSVFRIAVSQKQIVRRNIIADAKCCQDNPIPITPNWFVILTGADINYFWWNKLFDKTEESTESLERWNSKKCTWTIQYIGWDQEGSDIPFSNQQSLHW